MALIACRDAAFAYDGNVAVSDLCFAVQPGDYLCVVGENGSGKSTLLKGLLRLKQPVKGQVLFHDGLAASEIGYLPQQTAAQKDFPASVMEVVLSGRLGSRGIRPFYSQKDKLSAQENMRRLGIAHLRRHCYRELSGGQRQRVLLARALCAARKLLLLDEPVAGLDPAAAQELYAQIDMLNHEAGLTVIMVSHDIHNAVKHASHVLHLRRTQVFFGTAEVYAKSNASADFGGETRDA